MIMLMIESILRLNRIWSSRLDSVCEPTDQTVQNDQARQGSAALARVPRIAEGLTDGMTTAGLAIRHTGYLLGGSTVIFRFYGSMIFLFYFIFVTV